MSHAAICIAPTFANTCTVHTTIRALVKFDISSNYVYAAGGKALAAALNGNQVMTELNLAGNSLGLVEQYGDADMSRVVAISNAIPTMGALTSLNISSNSLGR